MHRSRLRQYSVPVTRCVLHAPLSAWVNIKRELRLVDALSPNFKLFANVIKAEKETTVRRRPIRHEIGSSHRVRTSSTVVLYPTGKVGGLGFPRYGLSSTRILCFSCDGIVWTGGYSRSLGRYTHSRNHALLIAVQSM